MDAQNSSKRELAAVTAFGGMVRGKVPVEGDLLRRWPERVLQRCDQQVGGEHPGSDATGAVVRGEGSFEPVVAARPRELGVGETVCQPVVTVFTHAGVKDIAQEGLRGGVFAVCEAVNGLLNELPVDEQVGV
ncbi:hypothetical protein MTQ10_23430 [Streptomyces sp. XM83C]|nr:hypothetical protein [Streptomyces sp. XM83C]